MLCLEIASGELQEKRERFREVFFFYYDDGEEVA